MQASPRRWAEPDITQAHVLGDALKPRLSACAGVSAESMRALGRRVRLVQEGDSKVIASAPPRRLGGEAPRLRFGEEAKPDGAWAGRRLMWLDEKPAFELSFWCGTCPFLFKRLEGSNETVSLADVESQLADGLDGLEEEVINRFAALLPETEYVPLLLKVNPGLVRPVEDGDYFAEEQVATWGIDSFWGLPEHPQTPYYRTYETAIDPDSHLFEFIVPMVPPSWNDGARVAEHRERLTKSSRPTAIAVSLLDVCQPAVDDHSRDYFAHWALTHFLLDGHHKVEAAAEAGESLQLLALLSVDASLANRDQVTSIAKVRAAGMARRQPARD